jgi:hypothetical protein
MMSVQRLYSIDNRKINDCEEVGGIIIGRGNRNIRRKPAPVPLCSPQIPYDLTWDRTRGTVKVGAVE